MGLEEALALCPDTDSLEAILARSPGAATAPAADRPPPFIYFAVPTGGSLDALALPSVVMPSRHPVRLVPTRGTAGSFNHLWVNALNSRKPLGVTHYAMHHSDIGAPPFWLDCLLSEMDRVGADILSCCIAIKDDRGLTSTAVRNGKTRHIRRLTVTELQSLPETFSLADIPWADPGNDALLLNNGLWCCRFTEPWVEEVCFRFIEWNFKLPDGSFQAAFFSEDWEFSEWATVKGLKLFATHKIPIVHAGRRDFTVNGTAWGDWTEEMGDQPRI